MDACPAAEYDLELSFRFQRTSTGVPRLNGEEFSIPLEPQIYTSCSSVVHRLLDLGASEKNQRTE